MKNCILALLLSLSITALQAKVETYTIDQSHSSVSFKVRHFFTPVQGSFQDFSGEIVYNHDDPLKSKASAVIDIASVDTNNDKRDDHLQQDDYFYGEKFPKMTFESTKWEAVEKGTYKVTGDLSFLGATKSVTLDVKLLGIGEGFGGKQLSGWSVTGVIDRTQWGLTSGQPAVGTEVELDIQIEALLAE